MKMTSDLIQIAAAGAGLRISAKSKTTGDLVQIAAAASGKGTRVYVTDASVRTTTDLVQIAAAGKGCVVFEF